MFELAVCAGFCIIVYAGLMVTHISNIRSVNKRITNTTDMEMTIKNLHYNGLIEGEIIKNKNQLPGFIPTDKKKFKLNIIVFEISEPIESIEENKFRYHFRAQLPCSALNVYNYSFEMVQVTYTGI